MKLVAKCTLVPLFDDALVYYAYWNEDSAKIIDIAKHFHQFA
jgi:hypothetical protein